MKKVIKKNSLWISLLLYTVVGLMATTETSKKEI